MNQWIERIQAHPIFQEISALEQLLESSREAAQADATSFEAWERIERVVKFLRVFLSDLDPLLVPPASLANSHNNVQQARAQLSNFINTRNIAHLNEANAQLDAVLTYMGAIPRLNKGEEVHELGDAVAGYRKSVGSMVRAFEKQLAAVVADKNALQAKIQELSTEVTAQKLRADNIITQMQQQFSSAQESRQTEALSHETKRADEFDTAEKARAEAHETARLALKVAFDEFLAASRETHESIHSSLENRGKALIDSLELQKAHAEKVVGLISTESVAHGYGKTANEERNAAKGWRILAVITLICWIAAGVTFFFFTFDKELSLSALGRQFLISTPFLLLAGFAALQVSKHQLTERINRQQELEIAAIDPYLATFDDGTRNEVKRLLAEKLFGQREVEAKKGDTKQMMETLSDVLTVVKEVKKSLKE